MSKLSRRQSSEGNKPVTCAYLDTRLKREFSSQFSPINRRLDKVEIRLTNVEVNQQEMGQKLEEMDGKIDRGFGKLDAFLKHLDDQKAENAAQIIINSRVDARLGKLEHKVFAK